MCADDRAGVVAPRAAEEQRDVAGRVPRVGQQVDGLGVRELLDAPAVGVRRRRSGCCRRTSSRRCTPARVAAVDLVLVELELGVDAQVGRLDRCRRRAGSALTVVLVRGLLGLRCRGRRRSCVSESEETTRSSLPLAVLVVLVEHDEVRAGDLAGRGSGRTRGVGLLPLMRSMSGPPGRRRGTLGLPVRPGRRPSSWVASSLQSKTLSAVAVDARVEDVDLRTPMLFAAALM